ncbi:hypothetical protein BS78_05G092100 [Paspalum vaginatum]|nr:hypothetical protein BS78_05G092100 [Paspalum vaginatum]
MAHFPLIHLPLPTSSTSGAHHQSPSDIQLSLARVWILSESPVLHSRLLSSSTLATCQHRQSRASQRAMESEHHLFEIAATRLGWSCATTTSSFGGFTSYPCSAWSPCIGGYNWHCTCSTDSSAAGTASLTFVLACHSSIGEPHNARLKFSLLDREGRPVPSRTRASSFQNWTTHREWQWECPNFITREDLERPEYLKDGSFTVRCDIALKPCTPKADAYVTVPASDLHRHLGDLLASKEGADVTFQLVAGGETFSAHRCVLAARSPVFKAQLFGEMKEAKTAASGGVVIAVDDMEARVFGSLLSFIYTDSLPEAEQGDGGAMVQYQRLLAAADMYGLDRMKLVCQEKLCEYVRADSVARMLVLADLHHCPGLKEACFDFLCSGANLDSFNEKDGFEVLSDSCPAVLKEILAKLAAVLIFE